MNLVNKATVVSLALVLSSALGSRAEPGTILDATGIEGGLVVQMGCGNPAALVALRPNDSYVVQGLDTDPAIVARARKYIQAKGLYGPVSVRPWEGEVLPYADNLVNLLVIRDASDEMRDGEIIRVLAPGGLAVVKTDGNEKLLSRITHPTSRAGAGFIKITKPVPAEIDDWSHYLHGPDNNAVSQDKEVAPPGSMRWKAGPMWCRSHEYNSSVAAMVTAEGRMFYIMDQGLRGIIQIYDKNKRFPPRWSLISRNAFNGVRLWERPMADWNPGAWGNYGFRSNPLVLPRRLVADGDKIYVTLSYRGPLAMLDAPTGKTLQICEETADTHEIVLMDGTLILRTRGRTDEKSNQEWVDVPEFVMAVDAGTGKTLWKTRSDSTMVPLSLAVSQGRVCYHDYSHVVCLDLKTGKELWRTPSEENTHPRDPGGGNRFRKGNTGILVIYQDVVLFSAKAGLESFSLETGKKLWTGPRVVSVAPQNCFVSTGLFCAQDVVWPMIEPGTMHDRSSFAKFKGYDPRTGEVKKSVDVSHLLSQGHHVRCYPSKATERYLMLPKRGVEFMDLTGDDHMRHDWLRGVCAYGVMPANGMIYLPPHQCFCYPGVVLKGFNALSAAVPVVPEKNDNRLVRGPAFSGVPLRNTANPEDWPTYRHDRFRSGRAGGNVPADANEKWRITLGGKLAQPIVSGNHLYAVRKDAHTIYCLDVKKGETIWTYSADGRIDSSPTAYRGLLLFGCRDGWVYCLNAAEGKLAWKFRAAPVERQITAFEQLESTWPVHGSVLVQNDIVYCTAGRSTFLDGGIYVYGLKPTTGEVLYRNVVKSDRPDVTKDPGRPFDMSGALSDILVSDGTDLYMYQVRLNPDLTRGEAPRVTSLGARKMGLHLMSTKGFIDETWYDRTYWSYSQKWPGFYFSNLGPKTGQILSFDKDTTYGVKVFLKHEGAWWNGGHSPFFIPGEMNYELFADANSNEPELKSPDHEKGKGYTRANPAKWKKEISVRVLAMVLAGDKLFMAGPPNVVPAKDPFAAFEGRAGSKFCVFSVSNGEKLSECELDCVPVFDGLIAAWNRLFMATTSGDIACFGK